MNLKIVSQQGELICDSLPYYECTHCILTNQSHGYANIKCQRDRENKRIAYHKNEHGELFACSRNAKTTKLFKDEVNSTVYCLKSLIALSGEVRQYTMAETSNRVNRIIHNLKIINAHAMQELYALVPQEQLIKNVRENSKIVESAIKKDVRQAALTFFRMAKFNLSIKAEFSIYEKLLQGGEKLKLEKRNHNIRDVIMIVLYMFFNDFNEKDVYIDIEEYYEKVYVDFESVQVAIYHIIENAAKYIAPKTNANITFKIEKHTQYIIFAMTSLYINQDEEFEIFNEGYSGIVAKQLKKAGKGIGMYRAKRLIELNNGTLTVEAGEAIKINGIDYANNKFIIALPIS